MNEKENDREQLNLLVDKLELDNWNAEFEKYKGRTRADGEDLKIASNDQITAIPR